MMVAKTSSSPLRPRRTLRFDCSLTAEDAEDAEEASFHISSDSSDSRGRFVSWCGP